MLLLAADTLDDLERVRTATENRVRALCDVKGAADSKEAQKMDGLVAALKGLEHQAELELKRRVREHPYGPWIKQMHGIGEKQGARLLAAIGDPTWNDAEDRSRRGPAELWAYCGYAPGQKRQKGVKSNWNASAKMRAFLVAEKCVEAGIRKQDGCDDSDGYDLDHRTAISPLGAVYLARRTHTAATHPEWTRGHSQNDALRIVAKEILKDLWRWGRAEGDSEPKTATPAPLHEVFA